MLKAVLDSTVLVSAFLKPIAVGASFEVLRHAVEGHYELWLSHDILDETERVLLTTARIRRRYEYPDSAAAAYCRGVRRLAAIVSDLPDIRVVRDPTDDMIVATAVAAGADYIVTRDDDLLSLKAYRRIKMLVPEKFLQALRSD